ncbi:hypothetical protein BKA70DRAFT_1425677 [Coprinopsis sp. MPI-PUGE-AT-0042]|nr:hypothetical protein BKA70DRAFT_1425677 [Coprinopsis sp. MPI-PUGE-AT-0042]
MSCLPCSDSAEVSHSASVGYVAQGNIPQHSYISPDWRVPQATQMQPSPPMSTTRSSVRAPSSLGAIAPSSARPPLTPLPQASVRRSRDRALGSSSSRSHSALMSPSISSRRGETPARGANATLSPLAPSVDGFHSFPPIGLPPPVTMPYVAMPPPPTTAISAVSSEYKNDRHEGKTRRSTRSTRKGSALGLSGLDSLGAVSPLRQPEEIFSPEVAAQAQFPLPVATSSYTVTQTQRRRGNKKGAQPQVNVVNNHYHTGDIWHVHAANPTTLPSGQYPSQGFILATNYTGGPNASPWGQMDSSVVANPRAPVIPSFPQSNNT